MSQAEFYYVTLRRGKRIALLAGPFERLELAQPYIEPAAALAYAADQWTWFDPHGVTRFRQDVGSGRFNDALRISAGAH